MLSPEYHNMVIVSSSIYDGEGRLTESRSYFGTGANDYYATKYQYDWREQLQYTILPADDDGRVTYAMNYYDNLGRVVKSEWYWDDDADGELEPWTNESTPDDDQILSRVVTHYDNLGRVYRTDVYAVDPTESTVIAVGAALENNTWYDAAGNVVKTADPLDRETTIDYDGLGRQKKVTQPDPDGVGAQLAPWTVYAYDDAGNLLSVTDRLDHATTYGYDAIGRKVSETDANGDTTEYAFDAAGRLSSLTDPVLNTTTWVYDDLGRAIEETNELSDTRYFEYDAMGRLKTKTDRNGRVTEYAYDFLGRNTGELWKDGETTVREFTFTYDLLGRLLSASDPDATYAYEYDAAGHILEETQTIAGLTPVVTLISQYDVLGRRSQLTTTIGGTTDAVTDYLYDNYGRLQSIRQRGATGGNEVAEKRVDLTYDDASQWDTISRYADLAAGDLVATGDYGYDLAGRLTSLLYSQPNSTGLPTYTWSFDAGSRMTEYVNSIDGTVDYTNDDAGQLTAADYDYQSDENYAYDENGNRITANGDTYATGDNNQLLSDGTHAYLYDAEGNRTAKFIDADDSGSITTGDSEITEYAWDYRNRLTSVTEYATYSDYLAEMPEQVVSYSYDYQNRLIRKVLDSDGDLTPDASSIFDPTPSGRGQGQGGDGVGQIALQFDKIGTGSASAADLSHRYLWGDAVDQLLADEQVADLETAGDVLWPLVDHLNTVRDLAEYDAGSDETTIANHRTFHAYGNVTDETNSAVDCFFAFTGRAFDEDSNLQYNLNRWYDAAVGRWMSEDPIGYRGGINLYEYVGNAPILHTDAYGLKAVTVAIVHHFTHFTLTNAQKDEVKRIMGDCMTAEGKAGDTLKILFVAASEPDPKKWSLGWVGNSIRVGMLDTLSIGTIAGNSNGWVGNISHSGMMYWVSFGHLNYDKAVATEIVHEAVYHPLGPLWGHDTASGYTDSESAAVGANLSKEGCRRILCKLKIAKFKFRTF